MIRPFLMAKCLKKSIGCIRLCSYCHRYHSFILDRECDSLDATNALKRLIDQLEKRILLIDQKMLRNICSIRTMFCTVYNGQ